MAVTYFKRYRMEIRLDRLPNEFFAPEHVPAGYSMVPWSPRLSQSHAEVKWESFRSEIDAHVFPCLGELDGCRHLMREIQSRKDFVAEATWLICRQNEFGQALQPCGTIQGLRASQRMGAIQNIGVRPEFRGLGLGTLLIRYALHGFRLVGCQRAHLEVTVENKAAIRLYERLGFERVETLFKASEVQYA